MKYGSKLHILFSVAVLFSLFLLSGNSASAEYEIKAFIDNVGDGSGFVTLSAKSTNNFQFKGWSGETCTGIDKCVLKNILPKGLRKKVTARFGAPTCTDFIYSEFGGCQLSGNKYRTVISAIPAGCAGGDPILSTQCFYDPCVSGSTVDSGGSSRGWLDTAKKLWENFKDSTKEAAKDISKGNINGAADKFAEGVRKGVEIIATGKTPPEKILIYGPPQIPNAADIEKGLKTSNEAVLGPGSNMTPTAPRDLLAGKHISTVDLITNRSTNPNYSVVDSGSASGFSSGGRSVINLPDYKPTIPPPPDPKPYDPCGGGIDCRPPSDPDPIPEPRRPDEILIYGPEQPESTPEPEPTPTPTPAPQPTPDLNRGNLGEPDPFIRNPRGYCD